MENLIGRGMGLDVSGAWGAHSIIIVQFSVPVSANKKFVGFYFYFLIKSYDNQTIFYSQTT